MGIVYRAEQSSLGRVVALKVLPSLVGLDAGSVARFRREAEAASRISHPGIASVHAVGEENGVHYFAMELVEGPPLDRLLETVRGRPAERLLGSLFEESGLDQAMPGVAAADRRTAGSGSRYARSCARIAAEVASALAAAHREGVIHRDVKPSNILVRANGQPVLVDFGLARDEQTLGLTRTGDAIGTPNYMAPEQACGGTRVDGRTDVWGLGATLYEMLTLRPPFNGANAAEIMRRIVDEEVTPVRSLNPRVPEDLARIVETCLRKNPEARYAAVEALELDLRNYLADRPVLARSSGIVHRATRFVARNRISVAVGAAVFAASIGLFAVMGAVSRRASEAEGRDALDAARTAITAGRFDMAQAAYGKARVLLGDELVRGARETHLRGCFDSVYSAGHLAELGAYLDTWAVAERDADWKRMREQVEGRGTLDLSALPSGSLVRLRPLGTDGEFGAWRVAVQGERLPLCDYLCEIEAPGRACVVHAITIQRDRVCILDPQLHELGEFPSGFDARVVPDEQAGVASLVSRVELSNDALSALLSRVSGTNLADEIRPAGWYGSTPPSAGSLPVGGISWRQARDIAILEGAHVPDLREYTLAATAGLPHLRHPFGAAMRWELVAASPTGGLKTPRPVDSLAAGASPHGILHLVGNVRELLAPSERDRVLAAGGDYSCDQEPELCVEGPRAFLSLGFDDHDPRVGVRLARFLPPLQSDDALAQARRRRADLVSAASVVSEWRIERNGEVVEDLTLGGIHREDRSTIDLMLATPGFAQFDSPEVRGGHDERMVAERVRRSMDVSELHVRLPRPARANHGYRYSIHARLVPLDGLWCAGPQYRFVLPMQSTPDLRQVHILRMPARSRIDEVEPAPSLRYVEDGCEVLVWDLTGDADECAVPGCAQVRFRVDGALADEWPTFRSGSDAMRMLCETIGGVVAEDRFARVFDDDFLLLPHGIGRRALTSATAATRDRFDLLAVDDVTAVGPIVAVRARVRWSAPTPPWRSPVTSATDVVVDDWPVVAFFRRHEVGLRAIWFGPEPQSDRGTLLRDRYRYEPMDLSIDVPPSVSVMRDRGQAAEVQVVLRPRVANLDGAWVQVLGYRTADGEIGGDPLHRLTMGEAFAPGTRQLRSAERSPQRNDVTDWVFAPASGPVRRERWRRIDVGSRWRFLVRCCVRAGSDTEAVAVFERPDVQEFFAAVMAGIHPGGG